jgi:hypothetical protein
MGFVVHINIFAAGMVFALLVGGVVLFVRLRR